MLKSFDLSFLVRSLVALNQSNRPPIDSTHPVFYALEYCTVRIDPGKGAGKTSFAMDRSLDPKCLIVVRDRFSQEIFKSSRPKSNVMTPSDIFHGKHQKIMYDTVVFDGFLNGDESLYHNLVKDDVVVQFIILG